jgi:regulator of nucleoside diphosphate kinase
MNKPQMNYPIKESAKPIILTTGIYDLLKNHLRTRKLSKYNEDKLILELRSAIQVIRKNLPENVVTVNRRVRVKDLVSGEEFTYHLVAPGAARNKNNTLSILSPIAVAILGYEEGSEVRWEMPEGLRDFRIEEVSEMN